ncbi:MAG: hypothetical protein ACKPKO_02350 [Candidatus Fonsibacter sp.]
MEASYYTKSQTATQLATTQNLITTSSTLTLSTLVAQTNVNTPTIRTTNTEFSDVANSGATLLSIKTGNDHFYVNGSNSRHQTFHILRLQQQLCV